MIARAGKPVARLLRVKEKRRRPQLGTMAGKFWIADDFDAPLPDEILDEFYK